MDIAYPIRGVRASGPDPLRWSLRTAYQHLPVDRVFIAGARRPGWLKPHERIVFIETAQARTKHDNIGENLRAVLGSEISEEFVWLNDDFFLLSDFDEIPLWARRQSLREKVEALRPDIGSPDNQAYVKGMRAQLGILSEWGFDDPICAELHVPIPLARTRAEEILDRVEREFPEHELGHFRALYGAGLPAELRDDVKVKSHTQELSENADLVSTSPVSWNVGNVGKQIRGKYWRRAPWESKSRE